MCIYVLYILCIIENYVITGFILFPDINFVMILAHRRPTTSPTEPHDIDLNQAIANDTYMYINISCTHKCSFVSSFQYNDMLPWASYQIRNIAGCTCAGNAGNVFLATAGLAIPTCITARTGRTCRDACWGR